MSTLKIGNKNVLQVYCGNKAAKEVVCGNTVMYYIPDISLENSSLSNWEATGIRGSNSKTNFHYSDADADKAPISGNSYTDADILSWQSIPDESGNILSDNYSFNCVHYEKFYLPQWVRNRLAEGATISCSASADVWAYTETGHVSDKKKVGLFPADTTGWIFFRQGSSTTAVSTIHSSGKPEVKYQFLGGGEEHVENSGSLSVSTVLASDTSEIVWGCLFNPQRIAVGKTCDYSEHKITFSNIVLTFTMN